MPLASDKKTHKPDQIWIPKCLGISCQIRRVFQHIECCSTKLVKFRPGQIHSLNERFLSEICFSFIKLQISGNFDAVFVFF